MANRLWLGMHRGGWVSLLVGIWMVCAADLPAQSAFGWPSKVEYEGGRILFRPIGANKANRLLVKHPRAVGSGFEMGTFPEGYEPLQAGSRQGFRLRLENGTSTDFLSDPIDSVVADGVADGELQEWVFVSWDRAHGWAFLSASGPQAQGNCLINLKNGQEAWICAAPEINPAGTWVVSATDFTESGERASCFNVLQLDATAPAKDLVWSWESESEGVQFLGWMGNGSALIQVWSVTDGERLGRYYQMEIRPQVIYR